METADKESLFTVLDLLDSLGVKYWVDGGWGIDILVGKQNREHRDIDINFDSQFTENLLDKLKEIGYVITTDWSPCRIELQHPVLGYLDIHPLVIAEDGSAKQADLSGGFYELESAWFASAEFEGRTVPCTSWEGQKVFHSGYELREQDKIDLKNLEIAESVNLADK